TASCPTVGASRRYRISSLPALLCGFPVGSSIWRRRWRCWAAPCNGAEERRRKSNLRLPCCAPARDRNRYAFFGFCLFGIQVQGDRSMNELIRQFNRRAGIGILLLLLLALGTACQEEAGAALLTDAGGETIMPGGDPRRGAELIQ